MLQAKAQTEENGCIHFQQQGPRRFQTQVLAKHLRQFMAYPE